MVPAAKALSRIDEDGSRKLPANKMSDPAKYFFSVLESFPNGRTQKLFGYSAATLL